MSRELRINFQGSATIYGIIRKIGDATVFNGATFETWADGNIGNYDVPLTNYSGDFYAADMPTAVVAGDYRVTYYQQAGGSPVITDYIVGTPSEFHWDGAAASSVSSVTLDAYALTSLEAVKRDLNITDSNSDTILTEKINAMSAMIERVCARRFKARNYRQRYDGLWQETMRLDEYPVQFISRITYGSATALTLTFTGSAIRADAAIYRPDDLDTTGGLRLVSVNSSGIPTATSLSFAAYPSVTLLVAAVSAVSGWSATTISNQPTADLTPSVGGDCLNIVCSLYYPDLKTNQYRIDNRVGLIHFEPGSSFGEGFWTSSAQSYGYNNAYTEDRRAIRQSFPRGFQNFLIEYRAGYETVPADVEQMCREMAVEVFNSANTGQAVKSETEGPYVVAYSASIYETIRQRLASYIDSRGMVG